MGKEKGDLTIGALASASAVAVETIRYYQREGLVAEPPRPPGGIRRYGENRRRQAQIHQISSAAWLLAERRGRAAQARRRGRMLHRARAGSD